MWFYSLARGVFLSKQFNLFNTNTLQLLLKINQALIWLKNAWKFIATLLIVSDITYDTCSTLLGNNPIEYLHSEQIRTIKIVKSAQRKSPLLLVGKFFWTVLFHNSNSQKVLSNTEWKVSKFEAFLACIFPHWTEYRYFQSKSLCSVQIWENKDQKKVLN